MKYFRFETIVKDFTTLSIVIPDNTAAYQYSDNLAGVNVPESGEFLALQHPECNVTEVLFSDIAEELKDCRMYQDINLIVQNLIASKYSVQDEIKLLKLDRNDPEFIDYQTYVDECRNAGHTLKIERGLKNAN